jgi:salicylate hydroxylase
LREIEQAASKVRAVFRNGDTAEGDALIGADGVKSRTRALLWGEDTPRFTGQLAYRFLVGRAQAAPFMGLGRGAVFLGPGATFNRYTLRGGSVVNGVAIVAHAAWSDDGWSTPVTREEMLDKFANWHPDVTGLMGQADSSIKWGLFDRAPLPRWRRNHATLLGDAAHAMLPFLGMGAAMAIEDGYVVARAMAAAPTIDAGLDLYEETRRPRTELLHAKSLEQGRLTQDRDPNYYDAAAAPASDQAIFGFDPVTAPLLGNVL